MGGGGGCSLVADISNTAPKAPPNTELAFFNPLIQLLTVFISDVVTPAKLPTLPNNCMIKQVQHFITLNKELVFAEKESVLPFFIEGIRVDRSIQFVIKLHTKIFV